MYASKDTVAARERIRTVLVLVLLMCAVGASPWTGAGHSQASGIYDPCQSTAQVVVGTPPYVWFSCPQGDGADLGDPNPAFIEIFLRDVNGFAIPGVPASDIRITGCEVGVLHKCVNCEFTCVADSATGSNGRTTVSDLKLEVASCLDGLTISVMVAMLEISLEDETNGCATVLCLPIVVRTADIDGNGEVHLPDLALFAASYPPNPYDACCDMDNSGGVDLVDLAMFAQHFGPPGHRCVEVP